MDPGNKYQCLICKVGAFKSRSDWLVHLVLSPHNVKVREHFKEWQTTRNKDGELYVIGGLVNVENSMLLEYIADQLRSFKDIVFFKPQANICMIAGDPKELNAFQGRHHSIAGSKLNFKRFNEISATEWTSYFRNACIELERKTVNNQPRITPASTSTKRKLEDASANDYIPLKYAKVSHQSSPSCNANRVTAESSNGVRSRGASTTTNNLNQNIDWDGEMEKLLDCVFMSNMQIESRRSVIAHLTDIFRPSYPNCSIVPVGADMLCFNIEGDFALFFDSNGITQMGNGSPSVTISDVTSNPDRIRTSIFVKLKSLQTEGIMSDVQCRGPDCIKFQHSLFDVKCCILLKPFMLAQTARLCKQLYFMNENVAAVLNMVVYWAMQHRDFSHIGLSNPFVIYWLVYFFFQTKKMLPSIAELQKSCPFEITDRQNNVAFSVSESVFSDGLKRPTRNKQNVRAKVEMLFEFFKYMDIKFCGDVHVKGDSRKHSLVCPRFATLIDKRKFKICWETLRQNKKKRTGKQKKTREFWKDDLESIGFEESTWNQLLGLKLPDTLCIQHPLYISENISLEFSGPFSKRFYNAIKLTLQQLSRLLSGSSEETSLLHSLSDV